MKLIKSSSFLALLVFSTFLLGCKKDDDTSKDQTTQLVGTYLGDYVEETDGASITLEDITTLVTKVSDDEIKVVIQVFPGVASAAFNAKMTDATKFTVPKFTLYLEELEGTGSLSGTTLNIDLDKVGGASGKLIYTGTKQ